MQKFDQEKLDRDLRNIKQELADSARIDSESKGFKWTKKDEADAVRYINGEIDAREFGRCTGKSRKLQEPPFRKRLMEKLGDAARWGGGSLWAATLWALGLLWSCFGVLLFAIINICVILLLILGWCVLVKLFVFWLTEDIVWRISLMLFLVIAPILAYARKNPWAWMTAREAAQAEYLADLLSKKKD